MKWIKEQFTKWWFWMAVTAIFLLIVQILFRIVAPSKWLDAVWDAGDLISLVGTLVLGYIAVLQTQRANDMASDANETSRKLIDLQKAEYTPVVTVKTFAGITKHTLEHAKNNPDSEIFVHEMRCSDGEVLVGYSISLVDQNCDISKKTYWRDYELHLNYAGRFVVKNFQIKTVRFLGNDFEQQFQIKSNMEMSLRTDETFTLFLFLMSNEDFTQEKTRAHQYLAASHIVLEAEIISITGEIYMETISIRKLLVADPSPELTFENAELMVSASYQVQELYDKFLKLSKTKTKG